MICYTALLIYRLLKNKLLETFFFASGCFSVKVYLYRNQDPVISARGFPERAEKKALAPQHAARVRPFKKVYLSGGAVGAGKARPLPLSCRRQTFQTCNKIA